jgi:hypothetical protein
VITSSPAYDDHPPQRLLLNFPAYYLAPAQLPLGDGLEPGRLAETRELSPTGQGAPSITPVTIMFKSAA